MAPVGSYRTFIKVRWCLTNGDISPYDLARAFYKSPHKSCTNAKQFLDDMVRAGLMRKVSCPENGHTTHRNSHLYANAEIKPVIIPVVRRVGAKDHAMSPIPGRRTNYSEEDEDG